MPYQPTTNFIGSTGVDLGRKFVTKAYLLDAYGPILESLVPGITPTPSLWTWGSNSDGQLGINSNTRMSTPVTTILGGNNWKSVACGDQHVAAIKTNGSLWVWGSGGAGRLGIFSTISRSTPVTTRLGGFDWKSVSCGNRHTATIKTDGSLWVWGGNYSGELGTNGGLSQRFTPVTTLVGGNNWKSVSCGSFFTAAIKTDGSLWVWGSGTNGQLGIGDNTDRSTPVTTILGGNNWKSVASGDNHIMAMKTDGTLWGWGENSRGQLGVNDTNYRSTPVTTLIGGTDWKQVFAGSSITAIIKNNGTLWSMGYNGVGCLGINLTGDRYTPVTTLAGGTNWKSVAIGGLAMAAIKTDGSLWLWGNGGNGLMGNNNIDGSYTPITTFLGGNNWKQISMASHVAAIQSSDYI